MDKPVKELVTSADDKSLKVFVRARAHELSMDDLGIVAGGRGARIVPDG